MFKHLPYLPAAKEAFSLFWERAFAWTLITMGLMFFCFMVCPQENENANAKKELGNLTQEVELLRKKLELKEKVKDLVAERDKLIMERLVRSEFQLEKKKSLGL